MNLLSKNLKTALREVDKHKKIFIVISKCCNEEVVLFDGKYDCQKCGNICDVIKYRIINVKDKKNHST